MSRSNSNSLCRDTLKLVEIQWKYVAIQFQPITLQRIGRDVVMICLDLDLIVILSQPITIRSRPNDEIGRHLITITSLPIVMTSRPIYD